MSKCCPNFATEMNINKKIFLIIRVISTLESIYFITCKSVQSIPAFISGIVNFVIVISYVYTHGKKDKWLNDEIKLYALIIIEALELPLYFYASSRIAYKRYFLDEILLKIDSFLWGRIFPKGQLSLYLDEHEKYGPVTRLGKIINNVLLIIYFTYYLIPYVFIFIIFLRRIIQETIFKFRNNGKKSVSYNDVWSKLFFILSVYSATYLQIFLINTIVPAASPRLYLKDEYKNDIVYIGLNKFIFNLKDDNSANSFPSGHVAETLCLVLPFFVMKKYFIAGFIFLDSFLITLATLVLRYHYVGDVIIGILNSIIAFAICYFGRYAFKDMSKNIFYKSIPYEDESDLIVNKDINSNSK